MDGPTTVAAVLIASFAIDRIVTGFLFLLSFIKLWARFFPDPALLTDPVERAKAEKKQKLVYFVFALILAAGVLAGLTQVRIFTKLGFTNETSTLQGILDIALTALVLVAGADRLAALMALGGGSTRSMASSQPLEIKGTLTLEQGTGDNMATGASGPSNPSGSGGQGF